MNRGTVLEVARDSAVLLTPDGQFIRVNTRRKMTVGEEISWPDTDRVMTRTRRAAPSWRRISSVVSAAALLILIFALWSFRAPSVVAYVSMDINPSVEIGLDAKERVRELRAVNDDALPIVEGVDFRGKPVEKVMAILAQKLTASHILNANGGEIVIASVRMRSVDENWEVQVTEKIKQALQQASVATDRAGGSQLDIETVFLPVEVREEARQNGISSGKMAFWLAAESDGHDVALAELKEKSVKKIASSWGGLKKVLGEGKISNADKEVWKQLIAENKKKKKKLEEKEQVGPNPTAGNEDSTEDQNKSGEDNRGDGKERDDGSHDGKKSGSKDDGGIKPGDNQDGNINKQQDKDKSKDKEGNKQKQSDKQRSKDRSKDQEHNSDRGDDSGDRGENGTGDHSN